MYNQTIEPSQASCEGDSRWTDVCEHRHLYTANFITMALVVIFGVVSNAFMLFSIVAYPAIRKKPGNVFLANMAVVGLLFLTTHELFDVIYNGLVSFLPRDDFTEMSLSYQNESTWLWVFESYASNASTTMVRKFQNTDNTVLKGRFLRPIWRV